MRHVDNLTTMGELTFSEAARRREKLLGFASMLYPRSRRQHLPTVRSGTCARPYANAACPTKRLKLAADFVGNLDDFLLDAYKRSVRRDHLFPSSAGADGQLMQATETGTKNSKSRARRSSPRIPTTASP